VVTTLPKTDRFVHQLPDIDEGETNEWLDSLDAVVDSRGKTRARFLMSKLLERARELQVGAPPTVSTPYVNSIPPGREPFFPGDEDLERRIRAFIRWNAAVMVVKANKAADGIGGHLATFASSAALYEVGFNHFFRGKDAGQAGDHVYIQGHAAPGIYARAFLEGRLTEEQLDHFRREVGGSGLSSYPHPRLMPDFWEYPTVSMGLGPLCSIYQARFNKYLHNRRLEDTSKSRVWCFIGDGECDEPETLGSISLAAREALDNLTWVVNCNLQRLDGPVRGNGKIIQELEAVFRGAGWNVIKVVWGSKWDELLIRDVDGVLLNKMNSTVDGEFQRYAVESGAYAREHFFGPDPRLRKLVEHLSDEEIRNLPRGGHDYRKLYAAYKAATEAEGAPTVILAKTIKGWTLGPDVEGRNATHQIKKMTTEQFLLMRERLHLQDFVPEEALADSKEPPYITLPEGSELREYMLERRNALDGPLPKRVIRIRRPIELPADKAFEELHAGSGKQAASTTTSFTRLLRNLCRDPKFGPRVVPIIPDEARTFGMDALFKDFGIYASQGQQYEPVDHDLLLSYKESQSGQILEEGITEAGGLASFIAAGTSYATQGVPMTPFFTFYSMFGFQRVGDLIWQATDARARGFLLGATAGRTTLLGEGLQHQDGHSLLLASVNPAIEAYDPAFAYEVATIVQHGLRRMHAENDDVIYYLTLYNENQVMPARPDGDAEGVIEGLYRWAGAPEGTRHPATILFSGSANLAAREAQAQLAEHYDVGVELHSATSYKRLREQALTTERWNRLHPDQRARTPRVTELLAGDGPVIAVTDYMKAIPDQIARWIPSPIRQGRRGRAQRALAPRPFVPLGTDGFGRSDTREALRRHFEVDAPHIVVATLAALSRSGGISAGTVTDAIRRYELDPDRANPGLADARH
jgi:pyruvate dehydrogenase E1 component